MRRKDWPDALIAAICRAIKERRLALNMSIYALSQKSGVSQQAISYYEREMRRPTLEGLAKVSAGLDWELSELISAAEGLLKKGRK